VARVALLVDYESAPAALPAPLRVHFEPPTISGRLILGIHNSEVAMRTPLLIVLTAVVLFAGSALAIMNHACKSSHHAWCAPTSSIRHHAKIEDS
jgi:hypothetical protein